MSLSVNQQAFIGRGCVACGSCLKHCRPGAISVYRGLRAIVGKHCIGCGRCARACPAGVIEIAEKGAAGA